MKNISKEIILSLFFAIVALISLLFFFFPSPTTQSIKKVAGTKISITSKPTVTPSPVLPTHPASAQNTEESLGTQTIQITVVVTPTPTQSGQAEKASISVSIDGVSPFSITLEKGKNQCDVLQKALDEKKISNLLTKYDSSLGSTGVYVINGLGKENAVWWTYTVNGKSPTQGCDHIAANHGDSVGWKYIGSR